MSLDEFALQSCPLVFGLHRPGVVVSGLARDVVHAGVTPPLPPHLEQQQNVFGRKALDAALIQAGQQQYDITDWLLVAVYGVGMGDLLALINNYGRACRRDGNPAWKSEEGQALKAALAQQPAAQAAGLTDDEIERVISRFIGNVAPGLRNDCRALVREVLSRAAPSGEPIYQMRKADGSWIDQTEASYRYNLSYGHAVRIVYAAPKPSAPVVAWVRFCSDGGIEGPILDSDRRMEDVRRKSGAWTALGVITPQPGAQQVERLDRAALAEGSPSAEATATDQVVKCELCDGKDKNCWLCDGAGSYKLPQKNGGGQ
ncbi:hypothetical protein [Cupriavidus gilardii]|uniref:hypothetical protein n=1 Tax=Cupriavidus gilardii TaxID=82541 RepID=UPI0021BEDA93|nr:hypothetical protein [Cupriavidus gilardii]MCT9127510.1 hypothetical protein [Cupriavidus gilardii]